MVLKPLSFVEIFVLAVHFALTVARYSATVELDCILGSQPLKVDIQALPPRTEPRYSHGCHDIVLNAYYSESPKKPICWRAIYPENKRPFL